jgi:hypothetical protein
MGKDMDLALDQGKSFREMMRAKLRAAARDGRAYYAYATFLDQREA